MLEDIDFEYLRVWGHYRMLAGLHGRIHGQLTDPALNAGHLANLGICNWNLGEYGRAIDLHTQALAIDRSIGHRQGEGVHLGNLGLCHRSLGEYRRAIDLATLALAIARDMGYRYGEATALDHLGRACWRRAMRAGRRHCSSRR